MAEPMRLQKWLAQAGLCSRREGERWISLGRVAVNGHLVTQPGSLVSPRDRVMVDGRPIIIQRGKKPIVLAFNKPPDILCTRNDPEGRRTIFDFVADVPERLIYVGRLDINSEGLLLFTNDGDLVHRLTHPSARIPRTYRIRVHGRINEETLNGLRRGVELEDGPTGPLEVSVDHNTAANNWLTMTLREGRNRIIRRIFETLDMKVSRLIRISFGPISLGELPRGNWRYLSPGELNMLRKDAQPLATVSTQSAPPPSEQKSAVYRKR